MPSDFVFKALNGFHRGVLTLTGNRLGWQAGTMPVLELTTIGRTSGQRRTVLLTSPLQRGSTIVVIASRGGDDRHPAWFLNLRDNPEVEVAWKGRPREPMHARVAAAEERTELWANVIAAHRNYAGYQSKTEREIPVVLLEPSTARAPGTR